MSRLLVATVPLTGHVQPMLLVVKALVARGHEVHWYSGKKFASSIEATGARFVAPVHAVDRDDSEIDASLAGRRGFARVKAQLRELFIDPMVDQLRDLDAIADRISPSALVADSAHLGAALVAERRALPWAGLGISALMLPTPDTAPFGSALPPPRSDVERRINRLLNWLIFRVLFRDINRAYRRQRVRAGLAAGDATYFDVMSPDLYLQPTVPAFEYPRRALPSHVHFIGPLVPRGGGGAGMPAWWPEIDRARQRGRPIVLVTQGTLATDLRTLLAPAIEGLRDEDALVVAITAGAPLPDIAVPDNVRLASYVPYERLLPHVSVMITNGGYGGVQMALSHGVPLVVAGASEEKPEIAARVKWSGTGIDLRTGRPKPAAIRRAVRRILDERTFRERAGWFATEMARYDAATTAATLIERLIDRDIVLAGAA